MITTISKSTRPRSGARWNAVDAKWILDKKPRHWKQVVELIDTGKKRNGKTIYASETRHIPA